MVETITPVVHGGGRRRWAGVLALHVLGATLSATVLGVLLGGGGAVLGAPWGLPAAAVVAVIALLYAMREAVGLSVPVLDARRQVPQWWREVFAPGTTAFLYGLGLGPGFLTHLGHGTLVAVAAVVVARGDPFLGGAALAAFGVARSVAVGVTWVAVDRARSSRLAAGLERMGAGTLPRVANGAALTALATVALAGLDGAAGRAGVIPAMILAATFGLATATKVLRWGAWRHAVTAHRLPLPVEAGALVGVPAAEAAVSSLVVAWSVHLGATLALGLLVLFSAALLRLRAREGDRVPCGCFGRSRRRDVRVLLARNAGLAIVSVAALAGPDRLTGLRPPGPSELVPAALVAAGTAVGAILLWRARNMLRGDRPLVGS